MYFCELCEDTGRVSITNARGSRILDVTCPQCVRGVSVIGAHEMLRDRSNRLHLPGEILNRRIDNDDDRSGAAGGHQA